MELGLSLGDGGASKSFGFMEQSHTHKVSHNKGLGFCVGLSIGPVVVRDDANDDEEEDHYHLHHEDKQTTTVTVKANSDTDPPKGILLIDRLPNTPIVSRKPTLFPWTSDKARGFDVNKFPLVEESSELDGGAETLLSSSPKSNNSAASSFQMDLRIYSNSTTSGGNSNNNDMNNKMDFEIDCETERASSRASDDEDENGSTTTRKKLRLSREQSAFLEEYFKEHNTLNPKQKLALAKQLNLSPRQVEVWFQNRRARTKLKQTEVDCEYLKRCCETLTEENRRLQKELQELRALKTSNPFYMQLPATTLTMCPSCERVATTNPPPATVSVTANSSDPTSIASTGFSLSTTSPRFQAAGEKW